jgi:hypothetical protein
MESHKGLHSGWLQLCRLILDKDGSEEQWQTLWLITLRQQYWRRYLETLVKIIFLAKAYFDI